MKGILRFYGFVGIVFLGTLGACQKEDEKPQDILPSGSIKYKITFTGEWGDNHLATGVTKPSNAHFTTLTGLLHAKNTSLFSSGKKATAGIESMAEDGEIEKLEKEMYTDFVNTGKGSVIRMKLSSSSTFSITETFGVDTTKYQRITLVSMIAPTADWFIGFKGDFKNSDGTWKDDFTIDAVAYDAGTEDGDELKRNNPATDPQEDISRLNITTPFVIEKGVVKPRLAKLVLVRQK